MANLKTIKNRNYKNFMRVYGALISEKHYSPDDAEYLARNVFDNAEEEQRWTPGSPRGVQYYYDAILPREEYENEYYG